MDTVEGKVAVVTGGASGIGLALATRFLQDGASVVLADRDKDTLDDAAGGLVAAHGDDRVLAVPTDVGDADQVDALAATTVERFGAAHVLCNNAGVLVDGLAWEIAPEGWRKILDVNLLGVANGIRSFVPGMIAQGEGHVVNTASAAGLVTGPGMAPYFATKHGVVALSEALHFDLQVMGLGAAVGVSVVCPEWVRTDLVTHSDPPDGSVKPIRDLLAAAVETGVDPSEIAGAVADALRTGRFWVLTHDNTLRYAQQRWDRIAADDRPTLPS